MSSNSVDPLEAVQVDQIADKPMYASQILRMSMRKHIPGIIDGWGHKRRASFREQVNYLMENYNMIGKWANDKDWVLWLTLAYAVTIALEDRIDAVSMKINGVKIPGGTPNMLSTISAWCKDKKFELITLDSTIHSSVVSQSTEQFEFFGTLQRIGGGCDNVYLKLEGKHEPAGDGRQFKW